MNEYRVKIRLKMYIKHILCNIFPTPLKKIRVDSISRTLNSKQNTKNDEFTIVAIYAKTNKKRSMI